MFNLLRFESIMRGQFVDPSLHSLVSTMVNLPCMKLFAFATRLQRDEFWKAFDTIAACSQFISFFAINYEKLDLISVFFFHFIDDSVPMWLKFDAIMTVFHKEVDDDEHIVIKRDYLVLEVLSTECHGAVGFFPVIPFHFCANLLSKS